MNARDEICLQYDRSITLQIKMCLFIYESLIKQILLHHNFNLHNYIGVRLAKYRFPVTKTFTKWLGTNGRWEEKKHKKNDNELYLQIKGLFPSDKKVLKLKFF